MVGGGGPCGPRRELSHGHRPASGPETEAVPVTTPAGTWSTNGVVWDMVRIGGTIYLGGEFTQLVSADGTQTQPRANLAAVSASTGQPSVVSRNACSWNVP